MKVLEKGCFVLMPLPIQCTLLNIFAFFHTLFEFVKIFSLSKFILNHLFNQLLM